MYVCMCVQIVPLDSLSLPLKASKCVYSSPNVTKISHSTSSHGELYFQRNKIIKRFVYRLEGWQEQEKVGGGRFS